ncbi:hypothetical protein L207DRAFT_562965 [Hyaloscypha variabilis F]|uniref:Uncharacterized protein n=1 Tax=Hyaloscypha variabilis (strain UAMH 11265 / GT02V1 / F) TaxID=1149755 RepID=A0A2J6RZD2_HYAVF|nr:hypothetical protein L207DRAFT_562965 [Hyaloscypha variabilis F]
MPSTAFSADQARDDQRSPALIPGDVCVGCIVWLPPKLPHEEDVSCNRHGCCCGTFLKARGYNHPVIVLKIQQRANSRIPGDLICTVACATSFDDTPLQLYRERRLRKPRYQESIPILDSTSSSFEANSQIVKHLVLEKGRLRKQSYVRLDHTYEVPVSMLTQYHKGRCRAYKMRLPEASYHKLMEEFALVPEAFEDTDTLFETAASRLAALAYPAAVAQNATLVRPSTHLSPGLVVPQVYQPPVYQPLVYQPPVYQQSSARVSQPAPPIATPIARYGSTSFTQPHRCTASHYPNTLPYSISPESFDPKPTTSFLMICVLGVMVVSYVWWSFSR